MAPTLGHVNDNFIRQTLTKKNIKFDDKDFVCNDCLLGKAIKSPKSSSNKQYRCLEMVEMDTTPFPLFDKEKFSYNLKIVDRCTGFIYTIFIKDLKANTILEEFRIYKEKFELITGEKIKIVRVDGGTEFQGGFKEYLQSAGIILQVSLPSRKHLPARAERAHRTIHALARSNHIASKLPLKFYPEAYNYSAYSINRMIRNDESMSPYEKLFNVSSSFENAHKFGSVCVITSVNKSKKVAKVEAQGVRCRFLGYGDDEACFSAAMLMDCPRIVLIRYKQ